MTPPSLQLFRTHWGALPHVSLDEYLASTAEAGFDGVEAPVPETASERAAFHKALQRSGLLWIAEVCTVPGPNFWTPKFGTTVAQHLEDLRRKVDLSLDGPTQPLFVNTMAGLDSWSYEEALAFHVGVVELQRETGVTVSVETHRGRPTFSPWQTRDLLCAIPELRLTADLSHWCVVSERLLLDDPIESDVILPLLAQRVHHIQPRVGYAQGPQVPDPRAPEYAAEVEAHERWWDAIWAGQLARGYQSLTMTPEFGPPTEGYLQSRPFTREPVGDQWVLNQWIGNRQRQRFQHRYGAGRSTARAHGCRYEVISRARSAWLR